MAELPLKTAIPRFQSNESRINDFVNGGESTNMITSGGAVVPSVQKFLKDKSDQIDGEVPGMLEEVALAKDAAIDALTPLVTEATNARNEAVPAATSAMVSAFLSTNQASRSVVAADRAELARDGALVGPIYPDIPTGRAAVTDGKPFAVIGEAGGEVAATLYLRTSSTTQTKIAEQPSTHALDTIQMHAPALDKLLSLTVDKDDHPVEARDLEGFDWEARNGAFLRLAKRPVADSGNPNIAVYERLKVLTGFTPPEGSALPVFVPALDDWRELVVDKDDLPVFGTKNDGSRWVAKNGAMVREEYSPAADSAVRTYDFNNITGTAIEAASLNEDHMVLVVGQSYATGDTHASQVVQTAVAEHAGFALMPSVGRWPNGRAFTTYSDLVEQVYGTTKETVCAGMADRLMRGLNADLGFKPRMVFCIAGKAGNQYYGNATDPTGGLKRGSNSYAEALRVVKQCFDISKAQSRALVVKAVVILHGEADAALPPTLYQRALDQWIATLNDDIRRITSQSEMVRGYMTQVNRGGTPQSTPGGEPKSAMAQLAAHKRNPNLRLIGPVYFAEDSGDTAHPATGTLGYRGIGQMIGDALLRDLYGPYFDPLHIVDHWWVSSAYLRLKYNQPVAIESDDSRIAISTLGPGKGIDFTDGSATPPTVMSIEIVDTDTIQVRLTAAPTGPRPRIFVACRKSATAGMGRTHGFRSGIRSAAAYTTDPQTSIELFHWACTEYVNLIRNP